MRFLQITKQEVSPLIDGKTWVKNPLKKDINDCVGSLGSYTVAYNDTGTIYIVVDGVEMNEQEATEALREHIEECDSCYVEANYSVCEEHEEWGYVEGCPYCHSHYTEHLCDEGRLLEDALSQFEDKSDE